LKISSISRTINFYCIKLVKPNELEELLEANSFKFQMSSYYKFDFLIYNYKKEGCQVVYYEGVDVDDQVQTKLKSKSKISVITYPTSDRKDFLYQVEVINLISKKFGGFVYDPKRKRVINASDVKYLY